MRLRTCTKITLRRAVGVMINVSDKKFSHKALDRLLEMARARIGFYRRGHHHISVMDGTRQWSKDCDAGAVKWIVVVGRQHYFESVKDYPIGHSNDVRRVLKNETWRFPFRGVQFNKIERVTEQVHRVTSWVIKPEVIDSLPNRPLWVVPESALLEFLAHEKPLALNRLDETLLVAVTAEGIVSGLGQEDAFLHRIGGDVSSSNADINGTLVSLTDSEGIGALLRGVVHVLKTAPLRFWVGLDTHRLRDYSLRHAVALCCGIFALYLALSSAYLMSANQWVDHRLRSQTKAAETSMLARRDIVMYRERIGNMHSVASPWPPLWAVWDVFLDMKASGVGFRAVNMSGSSATYYVTVERATDLLDWLTRDRRIASAEFALPVRKVRNAEQCAIVVTFNAIQATDLDVVGSDIAGIQLTSPQVTANQPLVKRAKSTANE